MAQCKPNDLPWPSVENFTVWAASRVLKVLDETDAAAAREQAAALEAVFTTREARAGVKLDGTNVGAGLHGL